MWNETRRSGLAKSWSVLRRVWPLLSWPALVILLSTLLTRDSNYSCHSVWYTKRNIFIRWHLNGNMNLLVQVRGKQFCEINDARQICCARGFIIQPVWADILSSTWATFFMIQNLANTTKSLMQKKLQLKFYKNMISYSGSWNVTTSTGCWIFRL